jgi:hypothetical protein
VKKIGLILLIAVFALGVLGVGYAQWTSAFTVNGTVQMGTVVAGVYDAGSAGSPNYSGFGPVGNGYYAGVNEVFSNAYEGEAINYHVWLGNVGTLPVKFQMTMGSITGYPGILGGATWTGTVNGFSISGNDLAAVNTALTALAATNSGGHVDANLTLTLKSSIDQSTYQGQAAGFSLVVTGSESH